MKGFLGLSQDLDVIIIIAKKRNNKVNQAEKSGPADFYIWANVTRVNASMGLNSTTKVAKPWRWLIVWWTKAPAQELQNRSFPKAEPMVLD